MVKSGQAWSGTIVTVDATGALATPSVGPAGSLYVDGTANGASVTVTGTNPYKWAVTLPALTAGQSVSMYITATIATIATGAIVAEDQADTARISDVETDTADIQSRIPAALIGGRMDANLGAISGDVTAADNLETMLDGTGGATLTLKKLVINNPDALGVAIQVNAYNGVHVGGTNKGVTLQGGSNQALYMLSDTSSTTVYIEGPATGGKGISISSPSDGTSLPGASGIYIQTERGHPGILFDFTDPADAIKIVNSDNGNWVLDDKLFATASDTADAVRTELAVELAHLDADVSSAGGGLTAQETRDAMKLAPTAGTPAAGSVDAHLDTIVSDVAAVKAITDTLDRSALTVVTVNDVGAITIISTTNLAGTVTGLTIPAGWLRMYWTIKRSLLDADADAILQIVVTNGGDADDGVLVINGAAPDDATVGSLVVNQPAGSVAFALTAGATALLQEAGSLVWDLKYHLDDLDEAKTQCAVGTASITLAVTLT